jgi:ABC-type multidrug transport system permease subunit
MVDGIVSAAVGNTEITCTSNEILQVEPAYNLTCDGFLGAFADASGGKVLTPNSRDICSYCPATSSNVLLGQFDISYSTRWRDFGIIWVYIFLNIGFALGFYWAFRVPKQRSTKQG